MVTDGPLGFNRLLDEPVGSDGTGEDARSELFLFPSDERVAAGISEGSEVGWDSAGQSFDLFGGKQSALSGPLARTHTAFTKKQLYSYKYLNAS